MEGRQEMAEEVRGRTEAYECKEQPKMKLESTFKMLFFVLFFKEKNKNVFCFFFSGADTQAFLTETMKLNAETKNMFTQPYISNYLQRAEMKQSGASSLQTVALRG